MSGTADNIFLARTDHSGLSLLTLHFSQREDVEVLKLAATLNTTPEQLIRQIVRTHFPDNACLEPTEQIPPWL
ncbi:hypothetical protein ACF1AJ_17695 [Leifsonia sp. NPDC014704]|uniref:hypothetical protein n=1 Tax=Leifsonia sp. NPDC014704 TaxID=3364123 RepID=UPI0036F461EB